MISKREASPNADIVEGDILVDQVEAGIPGMLEAVATTDTNRSTVNSEQSLGKSMMVHIWFHVQIVERRCRSICN